MLVPALLIGVSSVVSQWCILYIPVTGASLSIKQTLFDFPMKWCLFHLPVEGWIVMGKMV